MTDESASETAEPSPQPTDREVTVRGTENDGGSVRPQYAPPAQEEFDWRGWVLVGVIAVSFLVVPASILYLPYAQGFIASIGISWTQAYLTLPMIPALLLGGTAIWAALRSRSTDE